MDKSAKFWNWIAPRYSRTPVADEAAYQKKLEITRGYFRPDMEVLEFGCGTGSTAIVHAPFVKHITAIDFSSSMIDICREKAAAAGIDNITFECSTFADFSTPDKTYDAVLALNILHLLENWEEAIGQVYKMLKPGGVFVSSTACASDTIFRFLKPVIVTGRFFGLLPLVRFITRQQLEQAVTDAGFTIDHEWLPKKNAAVFIVAKKGA